MEVISITFKFSKPLKIFKDVALPACCIALDMRHLGKSIIVALRQAILQAVITTDNIYAYPKIISGFELCDDINCWEVTLLVTSPFWERTSSRNHQSNVTHGQK